MTKARPSTRARALGVAALTLGALAALAGSANADTDERRALQAVGPAPPPPVPAPPAPPAPPPAPPPPLPPPPEPPRPHVEPLPEDGFAAVPSSPEAPPAPPAATDTPPPASDADVAALAALVSDPSSEGGDSALNPDEVTFSLYGFADFSYFTQIGKKVITANQYPTFMVGNLNVYFSTEFERRWRSLAEVRFLYAPHGAWLADNQFENNSSPRGDTSFLDGSDL